jgi:Pgp3 C-terminal domain
MAAIDFPASPTNGQQFTAASGVTYIWLASPGIWYQTASPIAFVGATPPASPGAGQLWFNSDASIGGGTLYVWYVDPNTSQWVPASPAATPGSLIQTVFVETGAVATGTTIIPQDDTIPQITEGTEFMTCTITPRSATSKLIIEVTAVISNSTVAAVGLALFQDAGANAIACAIWINPTASFANTVSFRHVMTSGTTSTTTFRFRAGPSTAATLSFNGQTGVRVFGGVMASSIVIQEVA